MADRKENEMSSGYPAKIRALDSSGNSIYTSASVIGSMIEDMVGRYEHYHGAIEQFSHNGNIVCALLKKVSGNTSCWFHIVALGSVGGGTTPMDAYVYLACNYDGTFIKKDIRVVGVVKFGTCTYNGERYYCLCDTGYAGDYRLNCYFYDGYMPKDEFRIITTKNVTELSVENING